MYKLLTSGTQHTLGPNGERNQAFGTSNSNQQNQFGNSNSGSQTNTENFDENGVQGSKSSASSFSNSANNGFNGNEGFNGFRGRRDVDENEPQIRSNRQRRYARRQPSQPVYAGQNFGAPQNAGFPQFQQQNANGNALAQNQNPFFNQNAGANTHSSNVQNPFGNFQNNGGSSISSNFANDGTKGQVSSANTDQQSYNTAQGLGEKNNAQSQSANFDPFGLQASSSNSGKFEIETQFQRILFII